VSSRRAYPLAILAVAGIMSLRLLRGTGLLRSHALPAMVAQFVFGIEKPPARFASEPICVRALCCRHEYLRSLKAPVAQEAGKIPADKPAAVDPSRRRPARRFRASGNAAR
jgi:hypothetical protein